MRKKRRRHRHLLLSLLYKSSRSKNKNSPVIVVLQSQWLKPQKHPFRRLTPQVGQDRRELPRRHRRRDLRTHLTKTRNRRRLLPRHHKLASLISLTHLVKIRNRWFMEEQRSLGSSSQPAPTYSSVEGENSRC